MSVKLSTSRLRTAPGMGDRTGCYRCGQEGHWSKECPLDQNGSFREAQGTEAYDGSRYGARSGGHGLQRGFSGEQNFSSSYGPTQDFTQSGSYGNPGYGTNMGTGYNGAISYGVATGYSMGVAYGNESAYSSGSVGYGDAVSGYTVRRASYDERDPYGVVDYYEKFRARPFESGYFDDRQVQVPVPAPPPPPPPAPMSSPVSTDRVSSSSFDMYDRNPFATSASASSYYSRDRSPIRRLPIETQGLAYDRAPITTVSSLSRSNVYDIPRDPYTDRARYTY